MYPVKILCVLSLFGSSNSLSISKTCDRRSNQLVKRQTKIAPTGRPYVTNCVPDEKTAREQFFLRKHAFSLITLLEASAGSKATDPRPYYDISFAGLKFPYLPETDPMKGVTKLKVDEFLGLNRIDLYFAPFTIDTGKYELFMTATPRDVRPDFHTLKFTPTFWSFQPYKNLTLVETSCFFIVKPTPPIIVIKGGLYRQVSENTEITLDATESINLDSPQDQNNIATMKFQWGCKRKLTGTSSCSGKHTANGSVVQIAKKYVLTNDVFTVRLQVNTLQGGSDTVIQKIEVLPDAAALEIRCMKNCPPATDSSNPQKITYLGVSCTNNCAHIKDEHYEWDIQPGEGVENFNFDYAKDTQFGRTGIKFIINENVLEPNNEYLVSVQLTSAAPRPGNTTVAVQYSEIPRIEKCDILPAEGQSLKTWFKLSCVELPPVSRHNFYELFVDEKMVESAVSGFSTDVFRIEFLLPASKGRQFKVRVSKDGGAAVYLDVNPKVTLASQNKTTREILELYERFMNGTETSVSKLINSDDPKVKAKGIRMFQALVDEVTELEPSDALYNFSRQMSHTVTRDLLKSPPKDSLELVAMSDSMTKLVQQYRLTRSDPELANLVSTVCKLMVQTHAEEVKRQKFPLNSETQYSTVGRRDILNWCQSFQKAFCSCVRFKQCLDFMHGIEELPPSMEASLVEDYPDYLYFGKDYAKHIENLNSVTNNILEASALAAKSLALTTASGEHFVKSAGNYSALLVAKDDGKHLAQTKIQLLDITLVPSHDFDDNDHQFDILVFRWSKDLMWWNTQQTRVTTNIYNIQFWHSGCKKRIRHFKSPVVMLMDMQSLHESKRTDHGINGYVEVPKDFHSMSGRDLDRKIRVHRIGLPARSVLHIVFNKTSYLDHFDVVLTKFEFPTVENFKANQTIGTQDSTYMRIFNYETYDLWAYLGILPTKSQPLQTKSPRMPYLVDFMVTMCLRWNADKRAWIPDCKPGLASTLKVLNCECKHFSAIAGYAQHIESRVQELETVEIVLELQCNYVIFVTLAVTFGVYCLLLIPVAFRQKPPVYFVADNFKGHLYAYLVIVRTEDSRNAGTTSNVAIKLSGTKGASEPHVLNYPDPDMRLLQRQGEDMFVVATQSHLGPLQRLEVWYDCTGASPSWRCRDIAVYDLQLDQQWYFWIKKYFSVTKGITYLSMAPTQSVQQQSWNACRCCNHFHTWQLWAGEKNFSYTARLTVVFSNVLMIYALFIFVRGVPSFELRDGFDSFSEFKIFDAHVSTALLCACLSFAVHIVIAWSFRFSDIQFSAFNKTFERSWNVTVFSWIFVAILIGLSTSFVLVYGFWVPYYSSLIWLISCIVAIVFTILVLENAFIVAQTTFCKFRLVLKIDQTIKKYLKMIEVERHELYKKFDSSLLRPFLTHMYRPLQAIEITKRRIVGNLRRTIFNDLEDLFMYGLYNIILYVIILSNKAALTIQCKDEIVSMVEGYHTRTKAFSDIASGAEMYSYLNETLIPTMQPSFWYSNYSIASDGGLMIDNSNKYIGIARLRQHRMRKNSCAVPRIMQFLNMTCTPEFDWLYAEEGTFNPGWSTFQHSYEYDRSRSMWTYQTEADTETITTFGGIAMYTGGGYVAYLGRHLKNSYINLKYMLDDFWLDHSTRSVLVEFLAYNANYNVFAAVQLIFEQSSTGYANHMIRVDVVRMLFVNNEVETSGVIFFYLFVFWVCMLVLKLSVGIIKNIRTFYKETWLMIDLIINAMSIITIAIYVMRMSRIERYLDASEKVKHNEFVSYFELLYIEDFLMITGGILVLVATLRLWRFLRFGHFFRVMERTLSMAAFPLFAVTLAFGVICTAFGFSGILIFGYEHPELSSFVKIVAALIQLSLKPDQFDLTVFVTFDLAYAYFSIYLILMQVILLVYITVIIMAYVKAQLELSDESDAYTVRTYIKERMVYIPQLMKTKLKRLRGGQEEQRSSVTSKADEFRYANCVSVHNKSLKSMRFIVSCIIRNMNESVQAQNELIAYEIDLMLGVCRSFVLRTGADDDVELFFKGRFVGGNVHLVDEARITKAAEFVKLMFEEKLGESVLSKVDPEIARCNKLASQKIQRLNRCKLKLNLLFGKFKEVDEMLDELAILEE